jgi:hypothetical protein
MGMLGAIYHGAKGGYKLIVDEREAAIREFRKAGDRLAKPTESDVPYIMKDLSGKDKNPD